MSGVQPVRLVTVVGPTARGDFALAADAYPAEIARVVAQLLGEEAAETWSLVRGEQRLGITGSLAARGVRDGDILRLVPERARPEPVAGMPEPPAPRVGGGPRDAPDRQGPVCDPAEVQR